MTPRRPAGHRTGQGPCHRPRPKRFLGLQKLKIEGNVKLRGRRGRLGGAGNRPFELKEMNGTQRAKTFRPGFRRSREARPFTPCDCSAELSFGGRNETFPTQFSVAITLFDEWRRGAGVVERAGLENRCGGNSTEGSNPSLSATWLFRKMRPIF